MLIPLQAAYTQYGIRALVLGSCIPEAVCAGVSVCVLQHHEGGTMLAIVLPCLVRKLVKGHLCPHPRFKHQSLRGHILTFFRSLPPQWLESTTACSIQIPCAFNELALSSVISKSKWVWIPVPFNPLNKQTKKVLSPWALCHSSLSHTGQRQYGLHTWVQMLLAFYLNRIPCVKTM